MKRLQTFITLALGMAFPCLATSYTSASYVQDGLITQWDGIDNVGTGTHNPSATVWKDLAGNLDLTLTANGCWTNGNALSVNGASAVGTTKAPSYKTIEIVYSKPFQPSKSCVLFHSGFTNRFVVFRYISSTPPTNQIYFEAGKSTKVISRRTSAGEITSAVALYGDDDSVVDVLCDGERTGRIPKAGGCARGSLSAGVTVIIPHRMKAPRQKVKSMPSVCIPEGSRRRNWRTTTSSTARVS